MVGRKPNIFWQFTWRFLSPLIVLVILVFYLVTQAQQKLSYLVWDPQSVSLQASHRSSSHEEQTSIWAFIPILPSSDSVFPGRIPIVGLCAVPFMDQRRHLLTSRSAESDSTSVCRRQAALWSLEETRTDLKEQKCTYLFKVMSL